MAFWHAPPHVSRLICICSLVICVPDDKILNKEPQAPSGIRCYFAAQQYYLLNANGPEEAEILNPEHKMFLDTGPDFPRTIKCFSAEPPESPTLRQSVCCFGFQETGQGAQQLLDVLAQCREAFSSFLHPSIVGQIVGSSLQTARIFTRKSRRLLQLPPASLSQSMSARGHASLAPVVDGFAVTFSACSFTSQTIFARSS